MAEIPQYVTPGDMAESTTQEGTQVDGETQIPPVDGVLSFLLSVAENYEAVESGRAILFCSGNRSSR